MPHQCLNCGDVFADGSTDLLKGCPGCEGTRFFYTDEPLGDEARDQLKDEVDTDVRTMLENVLKSGEKRNLNDQIWSREAWEKWIRLERNPGPDAPDGPPTSSDGEPMTVAEFAKAVSATPSGFETVGTLDEPDDGAEAGPPTDGDGRLGPDAGTSAKPKLVQANLESVEEVAAPDVNAPRTPPGSGADEGQGVEATAPPAVDARPSTLNIVAPGEYEIDVERLMDDSPVIVERDGSYLIHLPSVFGKEGGGTRRGGGRKRR